jgi:diguanylate cyclase (GGDEF)-like protein
MAFAIHSLKIRQQILLVTLPPLFVLLSSIALFFYAYWTATQTGRNAGRSAESVVRGESLLYHLSEMFMAVRGYLFTQQASLLASYQTAATEVPRELVALKELAANDPSRVREVEEIQAEFRRWEVEWANMNIEKVRRGESLEIPPTLAQGETHLASLRQRLLILLNEENAESLAETQRSEASMRRMLYLGVGVVLLLALVLLSLTRAVTRLITEPVQQLIEASERVSRGDFQLALPAQLNNEFGVLSRSFSRMTTALRQEREEMEALNQFSERVTQCTSEREVYDHILHSLKERFHPRQIIIFKMNPAETFLEAAATHAPLPEEARGWPVIDEPQHCKAVRTGRAFRVNDVTLEPPCPSHFVLPSEGSYYCGPLIAGGIIIGAVRLEGAKNYWTPERETLLESYLSVAATALSNIRLLDTMKQQATIDPLTGLYNRRYLEDYAKRIIPMSRRKEQPFGVIMLDLDHFKSFNDDYGHDVGDRILRGFAKTVTAAMRETNLAARIGGEEFVVLLPETGAKACLLVAERIRQAVGRMVVPSGTDKPPIQVTVSAGIAVFPDHGQSLEEVLQASDKALYESKRAGRNRVTLFTDQPEAAS